MGWKDDVDLADVEMRLDSPCWDEINVGDELPAKDLQLTRSLIVAGAIASRDFAPGHHDHEFMAQEMGMPDIIASMPSTLGWSAKYINYWAGPAGKMKKLKIRLGIPACPGVTLKQSGKILQKYQEGDESLVDIEFTFATDHGPFCMGKATLSLPNKR